MPTAIDIMTPNVITVRKEMTIKELSELFVQHKINGVPVVDDGEVIGVVTQGDLIEQQKNLHIPTVIALFDAVLFIESAKKFEEDAKKLTGKKVEDIYHARPVTVEPDTEVGDIATLMAEKDVHTIPVIDHGKLVGVIGKIDIIKGMS
ncbi:membrane protein [Candidatus Nitromaritima sp. SCGC AAA799-A02]|nr:membrane protein [Candidatus Nitromaritima sp. SCGC AAA799-A02]